MIRLVTDHDVPGPIISGLLKRTPTFDLVRLVDLGLNMLRDDEVLTWAADQDRIVLSRDRATMRGEAEARLAAGETFPGLLLIRPHARVADLIDTLFILNECSEHAEWAGKIEWLPFA